METRNLEQKLLIGWIIVSFCNFSQYVNMNNEDIYERLKNKL